MGPSTETNRSGGKLGVSEPVAELLRQEVSREVLLCLHDAGSAEKSALVTAVATAHTDGELSDHDRVRTAIELEVDVLPELEEHQLITREDDELSLGFLSAPVYAALDAIAGSNGSSNVR